MPIPYLHLKLCSPSLDKLQCSDIKLTHKLVLWTLSFSPQGCCSLLTHPLSMQTLCVGSQTWDKQIILVHIQHTKAHLVTRFSQHPSVPRCYRVWLAYPVLYPKLFQYSGWAVLPPAAFPYTIQPFWYLTLFFFTSWSGSLLAPSLPSSPHMVQLGVMFILDSPRCPRLCYALPCIYNNPSPPP